MTQTGAVHCHNVWSSARFAPFDRVVEEDVTQRQAIARLVARALQHDVPAFVAVNNDAEGCAPESIHRLARAIAELASSGLPRPVSRDKARHPARRPSPDQ